MTCIIGLVDTNRIWMGGDGGSKRDGLVYHRRDPKVFVRDGMLIGFTSSFRMGQLLRYKFIPPARPTKMGTYKYMVTRFMDELRACFKDAGFLYVKDELQSGGEFLIGYAGHLFTIHSDFQVAEQVRPYAACGCGEKTALAAMYATEGLGLSPRKRILNALRTAEALSTGVGRPFMVRSITK